MKFTILTKEEIKELVDHLNLILDDIKENEVKNPKKENYVNLSLEGKRLSTRLGIRFYGGDPIKDTAKSLLNLYGYKYDCPKTEDEAINELSKLYAITSIIEEKIEEVLESIEENPIEEMIELLGEILPKEVEERYNSNKTEKCHTSFILEQANMIVVEDTSNLSDVIHKDFTDLAKKLGESEKIITESIANKVKKHIEVFEDTFLEKGKEKYNL